MYTLLTKPTTLFYQRLWSNTVPSHLSTHLSVIGISRFCLSLVHNPPTPSSGTKKDYRPLSSTVNSTRNRLFVPTEFPVPYRPTPSPWDHLPTRTVLHSFFPSSNTPVTYDPIVTEETQESDPTPRGAKVLGLHGPRGNGDGSWIWPSRNPVLGPV